MSPKTSRLRQQLGRDYQALSRTLRALSCPHPITPGSFYLMRRKCGKPNCRCTRGQLHPAWVLTRSEAGRHKLYSVRASERGRLRQLAGAYRRWQRARAHFVKQAAALLVLADRLAQTQTVAWPSPKRKSPPP